MRCSFLLARETLMQFCRWRQTPSTFLAACSSIFGEGAAGGATWGWWLAKADSERGGHRPKKGLLRGGKNRKGEGICSESGGKGGSGRAAFGGDERGSG